MYNSIRKVIDLNPINKMYSKMTHGNTGFIRPEGKTGIILYPFSMDDMNGVLVAGDASQELPDFANGKIYVDGVEVEVRQVEGGVIENAQLLAEMNAAFEYMGLPQLDDSYIGGFYDLMAGDLGGPRLAGDTYTLAFSDGSITITETITVPVTYYLDYVDVDDGEGGVAYYYYVAFRNTTDWTPEWNYQDTVFKTADGTVTEDVRIGEQDPGTPVTWYVTDALDSMTEYSREKFTPYSGFVGYELQVDAPFNDNVYYTYDGANSTVCDITVDNETVDNAS